MTQQEINAIIDDNRFASLFHIEILEFSTGSITGKVTTKDEFLNVYDGWHGGALYSVADTLSGIAASSHGYYVTTVNGTMNYLKAGKDTEYIICEAHTVKQGKTLTVMDYTISNDKGLLLNNGTFTFFNLSPR